MSEFKSLIDDYTKRGLVGPGVVAIALNKDGTTILSETSGFESLQQSATPISPTSIFRLASCTKLITTIAVLKFVADGGATLDDPAIIEKHLPDLCRQEVMTSHTKPFPLKPRTKPITLRTLLSHTSGSSLDMIEPLLSWRISRGEGALSMTGPLPQAYETPLLFEPGEGWAYGAGQDWAALLIERITGAPFSTYLHKHISTPLSLSPRLGFYKSTLESTTGQSIVSIVETDPTSNSTLQEKTMPQFNGENAGGGLMCSVEDYAKILQDLISPTPKVLPREMLEELFKPQIESGGMAHKALIQSEPVFRSMTGPLTQGLERGVEECVNHSLGGIVIDDGEGRSTMCWGGAFNWVWFVERERGVAGVFATGMFPPGREVCVELQRGLVEEVRRLVG